MEPKLHDYDSLLAMGDINERFLSESDPAYLAMKRNSEAMEKLEKMVRRNIKITICEGAYKCGEWWVIVEYPSNDQFTFKAPDLVTAIEGVK